MEKTNKKHRGLRNLMSIVTKQDIEVMKEKISLDYYSIKGSTNSTKENKEQNVPHKNALSTFGHS